MQAKGNTNKDQVSKEAGELYTTKYKGNMSAIMEYLDKEVVFKPPKGWGKSVLPAWI